MPVNIVATRKLDFGRIIVVVSLSKEGRVFCIKKRMIKNHPVQLDNVEVPVVQKKGHPAYFTANTRIQFYSEKFCLPFIAFPTSIFNSFIKIKSRDTS